MITAQATDGVEGWAALHLRAECEVDSTAIPWPYAQG